MASPAVARRCGRTDPLNCRLRVPSDGCKQHRRGHLVETAGRPELNGFSQHAFRRIAEQQAGDAIASHRAHHDEVDALRRSRTRE